MSDEPVVRGLGREIPRSLGGILAAIVLIVAIGLFVWSLIATWSGQQQDGLPLFPVMIGGGVVTTLAFYGYRTVSWIVALVAVACWILVTALPIIPVVEALLQAVTVTAMVVGINITLEAVKYLKTPRF
ncbi:MAG TPA: hypothetical protein VFQ96_00355 [Microbacteriaceae bacterium]|nr:hypothetical protein [Microbacteriaceae bacterium]